VGILIKVAVTAVSLWIATLLVPGISLGGDDTLRRVITLLLVAVIFGVVNAVLKPIIKLFGCGLYVFTLGLIALVVNGLLFWLVGYIADQLDLPYVVDGFWAGVLGAIVVAVVSFVLNLVVPDGKDDD
jgi:putative membrane protein